ncbi:MAG: HPF/RaiA family ribosome-associated protein [Roseiarcus sp.]|jgi:cold shock CspA family protein
MQEPIEIAFQRCEPSEEVRAEIVKQAKRLEKFSDRITSCRVVVSGPQTRHRHGDLFQIDLRIAMPEHKDVIVGRGHGDAPEREHPLVAIKEAFDAAVRQIEDATRDMRGQVKEHAAEDHGRVTKFLAGEDCGFIETADGREIYFHRNAVLDGAFDRLTVGSEVRFVEEQGERGAQASTVRLVGKHHPI